MAASFATDLCTLEQVAQVIKENFAIQHHPGHVWRILQDMGWSPQKLGRVPGSQTKMP